VQRAGGNLLVSLRDQRFLLVVAISSCHQVSRTLLVSDMRDQRFLLVVAISLCLCKISVL
jgi:hypothetical protein